VYIPNTGTVAQQGGTVTSDKGGQPSAPTVAQIGDALTPSQFASTKAANTSPTLADQPLVAALAPHNSGFPVNIPAIVHNRVAKRTATVASTAPAFAKNSLAGNSIIVVVANGNNGALSVADPLGNTYTFPVSVANSTTFEVQIFFAVGILG